MLGVSAPIIDPAALAGQGGLCKSGTVFGQDEAAVDGKDQLPDGAELTTVLIRVTAFAGVSEVCLANHPPKVRSG
jgi:hypothetical protein